MVAKEWQTAIFRIVKFGLGDDEINYEKYNKNHASGSAYYDLEILQTPVFEASTGYNAGINYGLMSLTNPNILYMPTIKRNELVKDAAKTVSNVYHLAMGKNTANALVAAFGGISGGGEQKVLRSGKNKRNSNRFGIRLRHNRNCGYSHE